MSRQPTGTVTFLFTDIEGSTRLLEQLGRERYSEALELHRRLLREAFERHDGYEVDCEGDSFFVAFPRADAGVTAAAEAQRAIAEVEWPDRLPLRVRMGLHTGEPLVVPPKYVGLDVHRAARVMAAAHGGQVVVSDSTRQLLGEHVDLQDLGEHRLKDLSGPQRLYQLLIEGLPDKFPPLKTLENRPTNLPIQPTPLIGRRQELEELRVLLGRDEVRLLTLTGPGGTGKTRLALQLTAELIERFPDGVFFVALASIRDPDLLVPTVAGALHVRERSGEALSETLTGYLQEKRMLVLLDNLEQIVAAAPAIASILAVSPGLKVLTTSRTPLHLSAEHTYDVPPLAVPDLQQLPDLGTLSQLEAVALFTERARSARPGFALAAETAPAIAEICVRLDGLPLALELAAARVRALPPATILARLDRRLELLTGGAQDLDERQRTLQATILWSYDLLPAAEQELFACLAVFTGGCRLDAAETVCGSEAPPPVLDGLISLVEKSLVRQREDRDGEPRYWMLETIREFADRCLQRTANAETVRAKHAHYFLQLCEEAAGQFQGAGLSTWVPRLENEQGNLRIALDYWRQKPDTQLSMASAIWPLWWQQGHWREAKHWLDEALAASSDRTPLRLKALEGAYYLAYLQADLEGARTLLNEMLTLARRLADREGIAHSLHGLANLAASEGDFERWLALDQESLKFSQGFRHELYPLASLGWIAFAYEDDYEKARSLLERAIAIGRRFGDEFEVARESARLATVEALSGDVADASARLQQSVELGRKLGANTVLANNCLLGLAALRLAQGDTEEAVRLLSASEALTTAMGSGPAHGPVITEISRRILQPAHRELGQAKVAAAVEAGQSLTLDEALDDVLSNQFATSVRSGAV